MPILRDSTWREKNLGNTTPMVQYKYTTPHRKIHVLSLRHQIKVHRSGYTCNASYLSRVYMKCVQEAISSPTTTLTHMVEGILKNLSSRIGGIISCAGSNLGPLAGAKLVDAPALRLPPSSLFISP